MLTAERLRELLEYDPGTGEFRWRINIKGVKAGALAGTISVKRYRMIQVDTQTFLAHRLAWLYVNDTWPKKYLDHINGDRFDNRIANLREATPAQSAHNRRGHRGSMTGIKGVYSRWKGTRFEAWIMRNGAHYYLGRFTTKEAAAAAYADAAREFHGAFARI